MSIKQKLLDYAIQLVEDREVAEKIVDAAIDYGVNIGCDLNDGSKGQDAMIIETWVKCYDYIRLNKKPG